MTLDELAADVKRMRLNAQDFVRRYAAERTPTVNPRTVEAIVGALGDISIDEACAALDREATTPTYPPVEPACPS